MTLSCLSHEGEVFILSRDYFHRRFKEGSDAWKVLTAMAQSKHKAFKDKVRESGASQLPSVDTSHKHGTR